MPAARRSAGFLACSAALLAIVAAFLPTYIHRADETFRLGGIDFSASPAQWLALLVPYVVLGLLFAIPGILLILGRGGRLSIGLILGIGTIGVVASLSRILVNDESLRVGPGLVLDLGAHAAALLAGLVALLGGSDAAPGSRDPAASPTGDWTTG